MVSGNLKCYMILPAIYKSIDFCADLYLTLQIPLINSNASHNLADSTLVRFRGMIQDMHNPEFYFEQFEVLNTTTNEVKIKSGKYRDTSDVLVSWNITISCIFYSTK